MKINIKLLKELLSNLDESKEIDICCAYSSGEPQKKANLIAKLNEIKESQKSPEDKIKEIEAELSNIKDTESF